ncbi:MAG: 4-hydroxy-3-methylbut-2-enyl diphosphate reductase [Deltaproteobacteria bacterium]|nr:4-hydroxy-3-methylbut-2-enyl diphosphate reductase [Deltaproteobacteria bacterium]MBM4323535.1 4-hydroxy-3-methylbut-2-enyl diphosphate reductase [Deltaproteobacteria bacterium]MBM4347297.1 4-hydroxy-3-methylbut-2-enyl diphosphate reductase [Deltaproteobacteria bacterium]
MKLIIAKSAGFCFGVKRAMEIALAASQKHPAPLYTLGPLIHNPQAVEYLEQQGIRVKNKVGQITRGTVILRSHGVSSGDLEKVRKKGLKIIDATCPIVKKAHFFAKFLRRNGYFLLIVGDKDHPEVEAIRSYLDEKVEVVEQPEILSRLGPWKKLGIIAQTTQSFELFEKVVAASLYRAREVRVFNTICHATAVRQKEAVEIAKKVDCMIVAGGYNSGNTQRLSGICREVQPQTYHIETASKLNPNWLANKEKIGLTAGASTPSWIIHEVEKEIRRITDR